jgi:ACS family hexuronate transporter-like MFS transporter
MFPKRAVGSVTGIGGMAGAVGGAFIASFAGNILGFWEKQGNIQTGYLILFVICGSAYLLAWILMSIIAPGMKRVTDL